MPPKNIRRFFVGSLLFLLFILMTILEIKRTFTAADPRLTAFLQTITPRSLDVPLSFFSLLGGLEITSLILVAIFYFLFRRKKILLFSLGLFVVIMIFELIGKLFLFHPGPPEMFFRYALPFATPEYVSTHYSFPSGHVGRTSFLVAVVLTLIFKLVPGRKARLILALLVVAYLLTMMYSRVYLGEHWASDVFGGLLLGGSLGTWAMVYF